MGTAVNKTTFEQEVIQSERPVLVDFWAEWCGPCHAVAPVLDRIAEERAGELKIVKVNIDEERGLAERYGDRLDPDDDSLPGRRAFRSRYRARSRRAPSSAPSGWPPSTTSPLSPRPEAGACRPGLAGRRRPASWPVDEIGTVA